MGGHRSPGGPVIASVVASVIASGLEVPIALAIVAVGVPMSSGRHED